MLTLKNRADVWSLNPPGGLVLKVLSISESGAPLLRIEHLLCFPTQPLNLTEWREDDEKKSENLWAEEVTCARSQGEELSMLSGLKRAGHSHGREPVEW